MAEIETIPDDDMNWNELARKYGVRVHIEGTDREPKNAGQIKKLQNLMAVMSADLLRIQHQYQEFVENRKGA